MPIRHHFYLIPLCLLLITACDRHPKQTADGYIEGDYTYISSNDSGDIREMYVDKGKTVKKGDLLAVLEQQPESDLYRAAVENLKQATKAVDSIAANLEYARLTYERYKILVPKKAIQQAQLDNARSIYDATAADLAKSKASVASSEAAVAEAKWHLDQKKVLAPVDGFVFDVYYRLGEDTEANKPILSLLAPENIKVVFYVNAKDLSALQLNDEISLRLPNNSKEYQGHVTYISPTAEYTPPVIYSTETNDTLIFRIEAKFDPKQALELHPGMPATVSYRSHG